MGHSAITRAAVSVLPQWMRDRLGSEAQRLARTYCAYPDHYWGDAEKREQIGPYTYFIDGVQFHYFDHLDGDPARVCSVLQQGATYYFEQARDCWHRGDVAGAVKFLGVLAHAIQDQGCPLHAMEGPNAKTGWILLKELIQPVVGEFETNAAMLMGTCRCTGVTIDGYRPRLLGTTPAEAAFHLHERYWSILNTTRSRVVPFLQATVAGDTDRADELGLQMGRQCARVTADILYTGLCMGDQRFPDSQVAPLGRVDLASLTPVAVPKVLSPPYRFMALVRGASLDMDRRRVPLRLRDANGHVATYDRGLGTGCHSRYTIAYRIPAGVYDRLTVVAGLHADLARDAGVRLRILLGTRMDDATEGRVVFDSGPITEHSPAQTVDLPVHEGGDILFQGEDTTGQWANPGNHIVWAEPTLRRIDCPPHARRRPPPRASLTP